MQVTLLMNGASIKDVQELLGQKTVQMTLRYAHLSQENKKKVDNFLNRLTAPPKRNLATFCHNPALNPLERNQSSANCLKYLEPMARIELATYWLRISCSTGWATSAFLTYNFMVVRQYFQTIKWRFILSQFSCQDFKMFDDINTGCFLISTLLYLDFQIVFGIIRELWGVKPHYEWTTEENRLNITPENSDLCHFYRPHHVFHWRALSPIYGIEGPRFKNVLQGKTASRRRNGYRSNRWKEFERIWTMAVA